MFAQTFTVALRILVFKAGPQDMPFDLRQTWPLMLAAVAVNAGLFVQVLPASSSLMMAAAMVGGTALVTRSILRARQMVERFSQTFHALLATAIVLTLLMLPLFAQVAPLLRQIAAEPGLLDQPDALQMPQGVALLMNLLNFWNFAVTAYIFRHAANVPFWIGIVIALIVAFVVLFMVAFAGTFAGMLFGMA